jgi:hypothetical protein
VQVVRVVAHRVEPLRLTLRQVILVSGNRADIGFRRIGVAANAEIDVRRHVHHVTGGRHHRPEAIGALLREFRRGRSFNEMNVVVIGAWMIGVL